MTTPNTAMTRNWEGAPLHSGIDPILRLPTILALTGLSKGWVNNNVRSGDFPPPLKLGEKAIGWRASAIQNWLDSRPVAKTGGAV